MPTTKNSTPTGDSANRTDAPDAPFTLRAPRNADELTLEQAVDRIKALQEQVKPLAAKLDAAKKLVKAAMKAQGLTEVHGAETKARALISEYNRTNADRKVAEELLDGDTFKAIFTTKKHERFEVK